MKTMVFWSRLCSATSSCCMSRRIRGSRAEKASSISSTSGSTASARASPTRCCMPPDNCPGVASAQPSSPTCLSAVSAFPARSSGAMPWISRPYSTFSRMLRCGKRAKCWNTMPNFWRRTFSSSRWWRPTIFWPSIRISPLVGSLSRFRQRMRLDLPLPDRPMTTRISPSWTSKLTSATPTACPVFSKMACLVSPWRNNAWACSGESPKTLVRPRTAIFTDCSAGMTLMVLTDALMCGIGCDSTT